MALLGGHGRAVPVAHQLLADAEGDARLWPAMRRVSRRKCGVDFWRARPARAGAPGTSVLDVGAGDAPYREMFKHVRYVTTDWAQSEHPGARAADVVAPADALPLQDGAFGVVLCTQVLEHVPEPSAVLAECFRVL